MTSRRQNAQTVPTLEGIAGPATGLRIPLRGGDAVVVGRESSDTPELAGDLTLSRRHVEISWGQHGVVVRNLSSTAVTLVNGYPLVEPVRIAYDDTVQAGETLFQLVAAPMPSAWPEPPRRAEDRGRQGGGIGIGGNVSADRGGRIGVAGGDITFGGDRYTIDSTGLEGTHGIGRFLVIVALLLGLAGFAAFGYPIVQGFVAAQESIQRATAAHAACDAQYPLGQERADCHAEVASGGGFAVEVTPWMPVGGGLFVGAMVLWIIGKGVSGDGDDRHEDSASYRGRGP